MDKPDETSEASTSPKATRRRLDGRTIGICVCIALVTAIVAGLVTQWFTNDSDGTATRGSNPIVQLTAAVDTAKLLSTPLLTVANQPTSLAAFVADKPVVVNLWAQSCAPCVKEMPLLEQASKRNPGITVIGVNTQDQLAKAKAMAVRTGITYPWVQDPSGDFFAEAKAAGLPTTFIIDPSGEIKASKSGAFASLAELQQWLDVHLA